MLVVVRWGLFGWRREGVEGGGQGVLYPTGCTLAFTVFSVFWKEQPCLLPQTEKNDPPVIKPESGPPIGGSEEGMEDTDEIDEGITHQEEEIHHRSDVIHGPNQNRQLRDHRRQDETSEGFVPRGHFTEWPENRNNVVFRQGLK